MVDSLLPRPHQPSPEPNTGGGRLNQLVNHLKFSKPFNSKMATEAVYVADPDATKFANPISADIGLIGLAVMVSFLRLSSANLDEWLWPIAEFFAGSEKLTY